MYQPKLLPRQIRALYLLKLRDKKPMTRLLREAVDSYLAQQPELQGLDLEGHRCIDADLAARVVRDDRSGAERLTVGRAPSCGLTR